MVKKHHNAHHQHINYVKYTSMSYLLKKNISQVETNFILALFTTKVRAFLLPADFLIKHTA